MAGQPVLRQVQADFSAGMFRGIDPEQIPPKGAYDIVGLLDEDGAASGRGGTAALSTQDAGNSIIGLWDGFIGATRFLIFWDNDGDVYKLNSDNTVTNLGNVVLSGPEYMTPPVSYAGKLYMAATDATDIRDYDGTTWGTLAVPAGISALKKLHVATAGGRLWIAQDETIVFTDRDTETFGATSIHKIPGAKILRIIGFRDSLIALTTRGVWRISNVAYNLTDTDGNVQHRVDQISQDVVPWGGQGVVTWAGGLIVAAVDGVWELPLGVQGEPLAAFARISRPVDALYRSFALGPWQPAVFRGHLLLPMDFGSASSPSPDTLVCRLDRDNRPWTRMGGSNPIGAFVSRPPASPDDSPELLGALSEPGKLRVQQVHYFAPETDQTDEGGVAAPFSITTRDFPTGNFTVNTATGVRLSYELEDPAASNPTIAASFAVGDPGQAFTALTGAAAEDATGVASVRWSLRKRCKSIRFKFVSSGAFSKCKVSGIESFSRPSAKS
jgi:hypothetical protein